MWCKSCMETKLTSQFLTLLSMDTKQASTFSEWCRQACAGVAFPVHRQEGVFLAVALLLAVLCGKSDFPCFSQPVFLLWLLLDLPVACPLSPWPISGIRF